MKHEIFWKGVVKQSKLDKLTGLPNQQQLIRDLEYSHHTNLAFIKFHNYNGILSTYGPAVTDDVVRQISTKISTFVVPGLHNIKQYHIHQSVFAVLVNQDIGFDVAWSGVNELVKSIVSSKYLVGDDELISLNVTVGAVRQNKDAFVLANMALQEAERKNLPFYFIDEHESWLPETYKRDLMLTQEMIKSIKENRLVAYFQPIFESGDRSVAKYECLARIVDENGQIVMNPNVFIPLAHRANLYYQITQKMVQLAILFAQNNQVRVSVNLSVSDINNSRTCRYIYDAIKASKSGHLLRFELLENEAIIEEDIIINFIKQLHDLGCKVGMDDLGKGHSNIERLLNLPIDFVKIDRSIMQGLTQNLEMQNLARGIVKLAHKKGLKVIAEYCSNAKLTHLATDLGADYLQGFFLGKPAAQVFQPEMLMRYRAFGEN